MNKSSNFCVQDQSKFICETLTNGVYDACKLGK